jgi:hypothetical protein
VVNNEVGGFMPPTSLLYIQYFRIFFNENKLEAVYFAQETGDCTQDIIMNVGD